MGAVRRIRVDSGRRTTWMPHLVAERRTLDRHRGRTPAALRAPVDQQDVRPRLPRPPRPALPRGHPLRGPALLGTGVLPGQGVHDHPGPGLPLVHRAVRGRGRGLHLQPAAQDLDNVRDRVHVQRLIDDFLVESGHGELREDKDFKFLKHDFRMYAGDLPYRDDEWLASFADIMTPYLDTLADGAYARLPRAGTGGPATAPRTAPRRTLRAGGTGPGPRRWRRARSRRTTERPRLLGRGRSPPPTGARRELDLTDLELDTRPFSTALLPPRDHRPAPAAPAPSIDLTVRTYDPGLRLPVGPQRASLLLSPGRPAPHGPLPPHPGPPRRLRGPRPPGPRRRPASPSTASTGYATPYSGSHTQGLAHTGRPPGPAALPGPDRPGRLPRRHRPPPGHRGTGGPQPRPPPDPLAAGGHHGTVVRPVVRRVARPG